MVWKLNHVYPVGGLDNVSPENPILVRWVNEETGESLTDEEYKTGRGKPLLGKAMDFITAPFKGE